MKLALADRESQEMGFTQPLSEKLALPSTMSHEGWSN